VPSIDPLSGCLTPRASVSRPAQQTLGVDEDRKPVLLRSDACFSMLATLGVGAPGRSPARRATAPRRCFMGRVERRLWAREVGLWPEPHGIPWNSWWLEGKGRAFLWPFFPARPKELQPEVGRLTRERSLVRTQPRPLQEALLRLGFFAPSVSVDLVAVEDVDHVEDVASAAHEAEHLGDVHGVARSRVVQQFAELRPLERVEAAGGPWVLLEDDRVLDPDLVQDEVLPGGRLLIGRDPLVDQVRHSGAPSVRRNGPYLSSNPVINHHRI
jgi:hypothetical protein